ncbi:MAG: hypothetical protein M3421_10200, partial [Bacteroidota bacterium]|nr:hypothetical protein [Bacteroidota bacterium]
MNFKTISEDAFPKLKSCAQFFTHNYFDELVREYARLTIEHNLPFFKINFDNQEEALTIFLDSDLKEFFRDVCEEKESIIKKDISNPLPDDARNESKINKMNLSDIITGASIRRQLFHNLITLYTQDNEEILQTLKELEIFHLQYERRWLHEFEVKSNEDLLAEKEISNSKIDSLNNNLKKISIITETMKENERMYRLFSENSSDLI